MANPSHEAPQAGMAYQRMIVRKIEQGVQQPTVPQINFRGFNLPLG